MDKPRLRIRGLVCACLSLSLGLCTLRAKNVRPIYGGGAIEYTMVCLVARRHIPTYPSAPNLHDNLPRLEVITLGDLLYAGRSTVEPEVMLRVSEDADVGFKLRHGSRHGQGSRLGGRGDFKRWDGKSAGLQLTL